MDEERARANANSLICRHELVLYGGYQGLKAADEALRSMREELLWFYDILKRWDSLEYRRPLFAMSRPHEEDSITQNYLGQWKPVS